MAHTAKTPPMSKTQMREMRRIVFPRDAWTCQDCGKHIPPRTPDEIEGRAAPVAADLDWLELDHIIPRTHGGPSNAANLRAVCSTCNRAKSNSLIRSGWQMRIDEAVRILTEGEPTRRTAEKAIRVLSEVCD